MAHHKHSPHKRQKFAGHRPYDAAVRRWNEREHGASLKKVVIPA